MQSLPTQLVRRFDVCAEYDARLGRCDSQENALSSTVLAVVFFFSSAGVFAQHTDMLAWYYDGLGFKYRAAFLFTFIACWHAALCSLGIPLIMYLYRTVRRHG